MEPPAEPTPGETALASGGLCARPRMHGCYD